MPETNEKHMKPLLVSTTEFLKMLVYFPCKMFKNCPLTFPHDPTTTNIA